MIDVSMTQLMLNRLAPEPKKYHAFKYRSENP